MLHEIFQPCRRRVKNVAHNVAPCIWAFILFTSKGFESASISMWQGRSCIQIQRQVWITQLCLCLELIQCQQYHWFIWKRSYRIVLYRRIPLKQNLLGFILGVYTSSKRKTARVLLVKLNWKFRKKLICAHHHLSSKQIEELWRLRVYISYLTC